MRAVTCGRGAPREGVPAVGSPDPRRLRGPRHQYHRPQTRPRGLVQRSLSAASRAPCVWGTWGLQVAPRGQRSRGRRFRLSGSVQSFEDKHHVKGAGGDAWMR